MPPDKSDEPNPKDEEELEEDVQPAPEADDNQDTKPDSTNQAEDTDWKASYQGLQRSFEKKRKEFESQISELEAKMNVLNEQLESKKSDASSLQATNEDLKKQLDETKTNLEKIASDKSALDLRLERQEFIMKELPNVAPMAGYIPPGQTIEEFQENAKKFAEDLGKMIDTGVSEELQGAASPLPGGDDTVSAAELDTLWDEVYELAGTTDPEKQKMYEQKYARLMELESRKTGP